MLQEYIEELANNKEIYFRVKVSPRAGHTCFLNKMSDGTIKIALEAAPEKGKANKALIDFLASEMRVRKYQIEIISGLGDKLKLIKVSR